MEFERKDLVHYINDITESNKEFSIPLHYKVPKPSEKQETIIMYHLITKFCG
jgi:hypothetical protein